MSNKSTFKTYRTQRSKIQHGDVYATASPAFFSRVIRFFSRAKVSHVGVFMIEHGRVMCYESLEGNGTRVMLASIRLRTEKFVLLRGCGIHPDKVFKDLGSKYDFWGAVLALFVDTKSAQKFCSESVAYWKHMDFSHLKHGVLPSDIVSALMAV